MKCSVRLAFIELCFLPTPNRETNLRYLYSPVGISPVDEVSGSPPRE